MTKADLVDKIHAKAGLGTKAATEQFLDAAISVLSETIANGEQVSFTGEECLIPASRVVKFTPGKALKEAVK